MSFSKLDILFRKFLLTKFFTKGWGSPDGLIRLFELRKIVSEREKCLHLVPKYPKITIYRRETWSDCKVIEGSFKSPFQKLLPDFVSHEIADAHFQMLVPLEWKDKYYKPVCIHLAGTGDHFYWRRRLLTARPLLRKGIGAILLENPFYGLRKPHDQIRSSLHNVSDIFVMGGCLIMECLALLRWLEQEGFGPLGVSGLSMGGHMASLAATNWPKPLVLVPCLSWTTASAVFTEGVMSLAIDWDFLQRQYYSDVKYYDNLSKLCRIVDDLTKCSLCKLPNTPLKGLNLKQSTYLTPHEIMTMLQSDAAVDNKYSSRIDDHIKFMANAMKGASGFLLSEYVEEQKRRNQAAVWFMRGIMDECTHLKNFTVPYDTTLVTAICAESDAYVPRKGCSDLSEIWPGATVRYVKTGHVGAYMLYQKVFRDAIVDAFRRAQDICPPPIKQY